MATLMPLWSDWLDYFGADAIGRVVGLWLKFCFSLPTFVFSRSSILTGNTYRPGDVLYRASTHSEMTRRFRSGCAKIVRIVVVTLQTLAVWAIVTSKPVWTAAGTDGDRILAGALMLVSATWVISVFWIFFSQPRKKTIAVSFPR
jgi:hypothetical protein